MIYGMARKEVEDAPGVITCTVSLYDHIAYALFDLGALHSFVSKQFVELTGITFSTTVNASGRYGDESTCHVFRRNCTS